MEGQKKVRQWQIRCWAVCMVVGALLSIITPLDAQTPIKVVGIEVNLRSTPSASNDTNIIGKVVNGQCFVAVEKQYESSYKRYWYKIAIPSNSGADYGWVAEKSNSGSQLIQEDSSLIVSIVTIINDGGLGWKLRYSPGSYDDYLKDQQNNSLKVWNGQKFIYKSKKLGSDGCYWWEVYIPYLKISKDWGYEDYNALFVRDDAIRNTGTIQGKVKDRATGRGISNADIKPYLKNGYNETYWNATTNSTGDYICRYLPESTYTLKVSASGFLATEVKNVNVASGGTTRIDIFLDDITKPDISNVRISPPSPLPSSGGNLTIRADVTDNVSVSSVEVKLVKPDFNLVTMSMERESGDTYKVIYSVPANMTASSQRYFFQIKAIDASGNSTESTLVLF